AERRARSTTMAIAGAVPEPVLRTPPSFTRSPAPQGPFVRSHRHPRSRPLCMVRLLETEPDRSTAGAVGCAVVPRPAWSVRPRAGHHHRLPGPARSSRSTGPYRPPPANAGLSRQFGPEGPSRFLPIPAELGKDRLALPAIASEG